MSKSDRNELARYIVRCFNTLDTFGKTPDQIADACYIFIERLERYDISEIREAFGVYMDSNSKMPTPADIIKIIDPPAPLPDWATYVGIKQKMKDTYAFVSDKERAYIKYCENYSVNKVLSYEAKQEAKEAIAQVEQKIIGAEIADDEY